MVAKAKAAMGEANVFRGIFFAMTFFTIGVVSNFRKLWEEGIAKLAVVYILCLFGFIIWVGLAISWLFFHGVKPPIDGRNYEGAVAEPKFAEELKKMQYERLLPIEKKLVLWSVLLGLFLLGALVWVNQALFRT